MSFLRRALVVFAAASLSGCALYHLTSYALIPDYPDTRDTADLRLAGLKKPVTVAVLDDGTYRIEAETTSDLYFAEGYLQARDRMFQMDLLRHMAQGRFAELVGDVPYGEGTALDVDRFNRFVGFGDDADAILATLTPAERNEVDAFVAGVNAWIATGERSIEHRLLGAAVEPWTARDSLSLFRVIMFGMTHNYSREVRRLVIACDAGLAAVENVWPSYMPVDSFTLPPEGVGADVFTPAPAVVPEMRGDLPGLCPHGAAKTAGGKLDFDASLALAQIYLPIAALRDGITASNNWVVSGKKTKSGMPILENDPHLPHLSPPVVWKVHLKLPSWQVVGFTMPGVHQVLFGHNFHVAWGETINPVDLQDLYVEKLTADGKGYEYDGGVKALRTRTETFKVRGGKEVTFTARYTEHGPLLNDMDSFLADRIPPTALRMVDFKDVGDGAAIGQAIYARNVTQFAAAIAQMDTACINWVMADVEGNIGYTSPCRVPVRPKHWGTFPVPGWVSTYEWQGYVPKDRLPKSINPARGWLATSNSNVLPFDRFYTAYDNDANPPNRYKRLSARLDAGQAFEPADMAALALDTGESYWPALRRELDGVVCGAAGQSDLEQAAAAKLCAWNGELTAGSEAATIFVLLTNAMLDRALADELSPAVWRYVQDIPHFEADVDWTWQRPATDAVWDDARTPQVETKADVVRAAFADAVARAADRYGDDTADWRWGDVRPFYIKHPFGGQGGLLGSLFNGDAFPGRGGPETVFKNQFNRVDREQMHPGAGPAFRFIIDMGRPGDAVYSLAGGESGWAKSPFYGNLTGEWIEGKTRPLTPAGGLTVRFLPDAPAEGK